MTQQWTRRELLRLGAAAALAGELALSAAAAKKGGKKAGKGKKGGKAEGAGTNYLIGCYTRPWAKWEYQVALDGIAAAGYKNCGLMTTKSGLVVSVNSTPEQVGAVGEEVKKRGLLTASIYCGDFNSQKSIEEGVSGLKKLIDYSVMLGCPNLLLGGTNEKGFDAYYKVVKECGDYAAEKKVIMTLKPHGGANKNGTELKKIIEMVGKESFRATYDPGNIFFYSEGTLDPLQDAPTLDGLVAAMCVKDFLPPKRVDVTPGTGQVKFKELLAILQQGGFRGGPMVVECTSPAETPEAITAEAKKALAFLKELTGQSA